MFALPSFSLADGSATSTGSVAPWTNCRLRLPLGLKQFMPALGLTGGSFSHPDTLPLLRNRELSIIYSLIAARRISSSNSLNSAGSGSAKQNVAESSFNLALTAAGEKIRSSEDLG